MMARTGSNAAIVDKLPSTFGGDSELSMSIHARTLPMPACKTSETGICARSSAKLILVAAA